jgi:hypothetical protein
MYKQCIDCPGGDPVSPPAGLGVDRDQHEISQKVAPPVVAMSEAAQYVRKSFEKKTGIPATRVCAACNTPKDIFEFSRHARSKDGYARICKKCQGVAIAKGYEKRKGEQSQPPLPAIAQEESYDQAFLKNTIFVPEEIYSQVIKISEKELRDPRNQAIWFIRNGIEAYTKGLI